MYIKLPKLPHQGRRSRELDFVRGIAILLVMGYHFYTVPNNVWLFHAFEYPGRRFGGTGVDLFFVLSGFLVGGLLMKEYKQAGSVEVRQFVYRRGLKIWPAYYVFLLVAALTHAHPLSTFLWQNSLHLQNYVGTSIPHTWTLSLEEHFYLLLALSVGWMVKARWSPKQMLGAMLTAMVVVLIVRSATVLLGWPGAERFTHNRMDSLLCGVCLAITYHFYPDRFRALGEKRGTLTLVALATVAFLLLVKSATIIDSIGFTLIYIGAAAFIVLIYSNAVSIRDTLIFRLVAAIGVYSYGIYLWHNSVRAPSEKLAFHFSPELRWPAIMILQYGLAIILGVLMTQIVEWPFLRLRNRLLPQRVQDIGSRSAVEVSA